MCLNNDEIKSIEFDESDICNLESIKNKLFNDENDPSSISYARKIKRPTINWWLISLKIMMPIVVDGLIIFGAKFFGIKMEYSILLGILFLLIYFCIKIKAALICSIKIYQRYAPEHIRNKCRFEPSCSEYMLLSLEKYGLIKGVKKGFNRLKRCNINNGGFDWP